MRTSPWLLTIAILAAGVAIGATTVAFSRLTLPKSTDPPLVTRNATTAPIPRSSAELGSKLLQVVGSHLIADDRATRWPDGPVTLFAIPKPYAEALCRVDVYTVAPKVVRGQRSPREQWDDDLVIKTKYGLWKRPSFAGGNRDRACTSYRDFGHLIEEGSVSSVARAAFVLDQIITQAHRGQFSFQTECVVIPHDPQPIPRPCDPIAILRLLTIKDLYRSEQKSEVNGDESSIRRDELLVSGSKLKAIVGNRDLDLVILEVEDEQIFSRQNSDEADVRRVSIKISEGH